jgi:hypothetical protein
MTRGQTVRLRSWGRHRSLAVGLAVLGIYLAPPATAQVPGARFMVEYCDSALPGGNPPGVGWHSEGNAYFGPFQTCASPGGNVGIAETGPVTNSSAYLETGVGETPGGFVESLIISASADLQPGNEASHICAEAICTEHWPLPGSGDPPRFIHLRSEPGPLGNSAPVIIQMICTASPCNQGGVIQAHYLVATEVDPQPPKVVKAEGTLLAGGVLHGHQTISGEATDVGGGLSRMEVLVNGFAAAPAAPGTCALASVANRSYTGTVATSPAPCPSRLSGSWVVNTAAPPFQGGANAVQLCASDLATIANPNTTCTPPQEVTVDNTCTESPVGGGEDLNVDFAKTKGETITVGFGQGAEVSGELSNNAGDPISGATICVAAQTEGVPGEPAPIATETTDASGQFNYELPPGPNRRVLVAYRRDAYQLGRTIKYAARSQPSLRLRPGRVHEGGRVRITGVLPEPAAAGRVVVLQASALHGRRWLTFRKATTGPRGGFRATYRFGSTTHTMTYRIRAVVPPQNGYPYAAGYSKPGRVKVEAIVPHRSRKGAPKS